MTLAWQDGLPFSSRFGDVYFSADSGLEETEHVFLQANRLAERFAALSAGESFAVGETGFGTGLNFLCTLRLFERTAPPGASLDFFSVERFPLKDDDLRAALALWPELAADAEALLARWRRRVPGWNRWSFGRVRLTLAITDIAEALPQLQENAVDAWFLDGFTPAKNPEMWSEQVLAAIARASRAGATISTYTSAGWVRRGLLQAGFDVARAPGFGFKREMLRGHFSVHRTDNRKRCTPRTALVVGGGISGCAAAHALAQRGVQVTLLERAPRLASAASGNPRGILHARFGAGMNALHSFVLASYGHALAMLDESLPADGELRAECGLLQLECNEAERKRIARLAGIEWPAHLMQFVDADAASRLAGMAMAHGGLWFPGGGWVVPPALCERLADHALIERRFDYRVETLTQTDTGWRAAGQDWAVEAEVAVVCCAHSALALEPFAQFPLTPVRGQVSLLPATDASSKLQTVVCGDGYCAPAAGGVHVIGATHAFGDESRDVRSADHEDNLAKLASFAPSLREALGEPDIERLDGRASVRCSAPGATPLVGDVQRGLYCSLAHGTRGLLTAGLAAETIAAQACGQLPPLPAAVLSALSPRARV
ncbi:MAG: bifunctional tRNA (5-methylaminomethyl-2-thiouridine)(34)-methyltransferase MnmD/FAD-dependent 5-carboxymethylaminomethyl-2-thiouridine(34) oxidoreductase MnmC [Gallionella sp.]|jgi:tRNA 5-methylaminomethyl-2-thiouridine biosynthesis bifunctional protein|nr:bifunctional tRNA (5-methylaminomethyl-2-thiouridine)(34)-methyltransferase MnmD/FAD-dependent 5-carboxymethylaminomethyl-2-thiouridine(34) oxidoreductase MnmC [Gallionella sp.]MCK9354175.1 bifunctional tRNA (5-methylaminomethyl-2-thiouridine)(34)-methyltransferase MnmD/FAD-dependent 5-carboxymethylaminomethyl-2-thiouridine(34) oxidoreductase MnmC [Gallionella sp.]